MCSAHKQCQQCTYFRPLPDAEWGECGLEPLPGGWGTAVDPDSPPDLRPNYRKVLAAQLACDFFEPKS